MEHRIRTSATGSATILGRRNKHKAIIAITLKILGINCSKHWDTVVGMY
jgi:hypothetical protein